MNRSRNLVRLTSLLLALIIALSVVGACTASAPQMVEQTVVVEKPISVRETVVVEKQVVVTATPTPQPLARYVFLFIGDGMGVTHRTAAELYLAATTGKKPEETRLLMNTFPAQGLITTHDANQFIPDSASAGTALATGFKTTFGSLGVDPAGKPLTSIAETAKARGMKVGIVTSVSIDHATPAVFYAHLRNRDDYYSIALALGRSNFDYFAGGGLLQPKGADGSKPDALAAARANGYAIVATRAAFDKLTPGSGKVLAINAVLDADQALAYEIDRAKDDLSLADYTRKGIALLDNPNGFFMMVEGGKIDWASHANDAATTIKDVLAFDAAIAEAVEFCQKHPDDTLIVVTSDHETGGMALGFAGTKDETNIERLANQKMSHLVFSQKVEEFRKARGRNARFEDMAAVIQNAFGLIVLSSAERAALVERAKSDKEAQKKLGMALSDLELQEARAAFAVSMKEPRDRLMDVGAYLLYGASDPLTMRLTKIMSQKAGIGWTTFSHTAAPVRVSAIGVGAEQFNGSYDNTEIPQKIVTLAGWK